MQGTKAWIMTARHFLAFDLGATSGRTILGTLGEQLEIRELTRFQNNILSFDNRCYWDIFSLYRHLLEGLRAASREGVTVTSVGIDTWGVDFAFVGSDGTMMGLPRAHRDPHTNGAPDEFFKQALPREKVYALTGIQVMSFNTLYQLYALKRDHSSQLAASKHLLFMPDALAYLLTGKMVTEYTIASTSQMLNPCTGQMEPLLLNALGLDSEIFAPVVMPGTTIGTLLPSIARECGLPEIPVVAVAGHDTASAVAAVPAVDEKFAYLSSGTWSLMGIEIEKPIITEQTAALNISNEGGVDGTTRLLKNITGLWLLERCLSEWKTAGRDYTYGQIVEMASGMETFHAFIDPDDPVFANPPSMIKAISDYCAATGQSVPNGDAGFIRLIFESLALKYRYVLDRLRLLSPYPIERLHIIGGGSRNDLLNRMTANATGVEVVAGPQEATAIGNIMLQARAAGLVGSLPQMRKVIAGAVPTKSYAPADTAHWNEAYERFKNIINSKIP